MNQAKTSIEEKSAMNKNANLGNREMKSSGGCCCSTPTNINRTREEKQTENSQNETKTTTVTAPEIVCGGCASSIKKALGSIEGVSEVDVDAATKKVTVNHSQDVSREKIVDALDRAGYTVV